MSLIGGSLKLIRQLSYLGAAVSLLPMLSDGLFPVMSMIRSEFPASDTAQIIVASFFLGMFIGQCSAAVFAKERFVREWSLYVLLLLIVSVIVIMSSSTVEYLLFSRVVQGMSVGILITIVRLLAFSISAGTPHAARSLGFLNVIAAFFAFMAPLVYALIAAEFGWRFILLPVLMLAVIGLIYWPFGAIPPRSREKEAIFPRPNARELLGLLFSASIFFLLVLMPMTFVHTIGTMESDLVTVGVYQSISAAAFMATSGMVFLGVAPYGFRTCLVSTVLGMVSAVGLVLAKAVASIPLIVGCAALGMGALGIALSFSVALAIGIQARDRFVAAALVGLSQSVAGFMAGLVPLDGIDHALIIALVFAACTIMIFRLRDGFRA